MRRGHPEGWPRSFPAFRSPDIPRIRHHESPPRLGFSAIPNKVSV